MSKFEFTFHNVGEGLFYSGIVGDFNFIYDCGSSRRGHLKDVIRDSFLYKLENSKVDLLILSHLHDDHVSGLDILFKFGVPIETAILPYLPPIERLIVALRKLNIPDWYYKFISDPVRFLIERNVKRVILIGGREGSPPEDVSGREKSEDSFKDEPKKLGLSEMPDDKYLREEIIEKDGQWKNLIDEGKLLVKNHRGYIKVKGIWLFRFFNYRVQDQKMNSFETCVSSIVKQQKLIDVIRDKSRLRKLSHATIYFTEISMIPRL